MTSKMDTCYEKEFFVFDWPEEETEFVKDYCNSQDLEEGNYQCTLPLKCNTAQEALDTSHWTFAEKMNKPFDSKIIIYDCHDEYDDKFLSLVERMARERLPVFKDVDFVKVLRSSLHVYPEDDGFMGWHTNDDYPAWRIYLTYTEEADKSYISYWDEIKEEEVRSYDKKGITCRAFYLKESPPLMHSIAAQTRRWSVGFKIYNEKQWEKYGGVYDE